METTELEELTFNLDVIMHLSFDLGYQLKTGPFSVYLQMLFMPTVTMVKGQHFLKILLGKNLVLKYFDL